LEERTSSITTATTSSIEDAISRVFSNIGTMRSEVYNVLKENYGVKDADVHISQETVNHIIEGHPEFSDKVEQVIKDVLRNVEIIQRNARADTVRIIANNDKLDAPIEIYKPGKLIVLILRLQPAHYVNFVKALYPRDKIRKSDIIWKKEP